MSDDAQAPGAPENSAPDPWAPPVGSGATAPQDQAPAESPSTAPEDAVPTAPKVGLDKPPAGGASSVHDQRTVTAVPGMDTPPPPSPQPWDNPFAPPSDPATAPAGPRPAAPGNPYAPPAAASGNPFAPPAAHAFYPQQAPGQPVPPPPIGPEGPGQMPYGYPQYPQYPQYPGHPVQGAPYGPQAGAPGYGYGWPGLQQPPSNGMGVTALVLGIVSAVVFCLWPLAILLGVLAVIFGVIGRRKAHRGEATNGGMALAGLICGAVGVVLGIVMIVIFFSASTSNDDPWVTTDDDGYSTSMVLDQLG